MAMESKPKRPRIEKDEQAGGDKAGVNGDVSDEYKDKLIAFQEELDKVNGEADLKVLAIEQEYNKLRKPIYAKRAEVLAQWPQFWKTALKHHPDLSDLLSTKDEEVLEYLTQVYVDDNEDVKSGFTISFSFCENPFFTNKVLEKKYSYSDGVITKTGSKIDWKEGQAPVEPEVDKDDDEGEDDGYQFMKWFSEPEEQETGESDPIADIIREQIWPDPRTYYEATDLEVFGMMGDDLEFDEEGVEEEEDDEEEA